MNFYLTSTVKPNLVKFHSGITTLGYIVGWHETEKYTQTKRALLLTQTMNEIVCWFSDDMTYKQAKKQYTWQGEICDQLHSSYSY